VVAEILLHLIKDKKKSSCFEKNRPKKGVEKMRNEEPPLKRGGGKRRRTRKKGGLH